MININLDNVSADELLEIYKTLEEFLKYLQDEINTAKKVIDGN